MYRIKRHYLIYSMSRRSPSKKKAVAVFLSSAYGIGFGDRFLSEAIACFFCPFFEDQFLTTTIKFHRDHTYAAKTAISFNLEGSGIFKVINNEGREISLKVEPGDVIVFNCKFRHAFEQTSKRRVAIFAWELQKSKGYRPSIEFVEKAGLIDEELREEGWKRPTLAIPVPEIGGGYLQRLSSKTRKLLLDDLSKTKLHRDPSSYVFDRQIRWFFHEPDLRYRNGEFVPNPEQNDRLLKFLRRFGPVETALLAKG
ncbi:MAG: hypothetical protein F6J93_27715 [Oscillatoria sp. SIO1A7]|nr:hypothetical protein [Oscillatoria sp. SIO1A7]